MLETQKKNIDIREYWQIFYRRKIFFIIPFLLCLVIGVILIIVTKPVYQSSSVVQISQRQLLSPVMAEFVPGITLEERVTNLQNKIVSYAYLKRLIETLNLYDDPKTKAIVEKIRDNYPNLTTREITDLFWIETLRKLITVRQDGFEYIEIIAQGNTHEMAYNFAKMLTQIFIDESLRLEVGGIREAIEFSSEQLAIYKQKLDDSEERLRRYRESTLQREIENPGIASANVDKIHATLTATDYDINKANERLYSLNSRLRELNINYKSPNNNLLNSLKARLQESVIELSKLMLDYNWQDIKILKLNSEIDTLQEEFRKEIERQIKYQNIFVGSPEIAIIIEKEITTMEVGILNRKRETLSNMVEIYKARLSAGPSREITLARLQQDVESNRQMYLQFLQQTRGSEIKEALQKTEADFAFKIVEPAIDPIRPIKPNRVNMMIMSIVLGAFIGLGIISLLEFLDHSFKNVDNIEKFLKLPVLGTMPYIEMDVSNKNWGNSKY